MLLLAVLLLLFLLVAVVRLVLPMFCAEAEHHQIHVARFFPMNAAESHNCSKQHTCLHNCPILSYNSTSTSMLLAFNSNTCQNAGQPRANQCELHNK